MRTRCTVLAVLFVALTSLTYGATPPETDAGSQSPTEVDTTGTDPEPAAPSGAGSVPCTPVGTTWPVFGSDPPRLTAPQLAVVRTDFRPKDVQLHLDGRFIGRARYFNGNNGYLLLEPGRYRLEVRLGGYQTELFEIEARPNCRFDIRHRMTRSPGTAKEKRSDPPGKGVPSQRVFSPVEPRRPGPDESRPRAPDLALRPDLAEPQSPAITQPPRTSSLVLKVEPFEASVFLDGTFVASGKELALMVGPLAIPAGSHLVEVRATGFVSQQVEFEVAPGELKEITVSLVGVEDD